MFCYCTKSNKEDHGKVCSTAWCWHARYGEVWSLELIRELIIISTAIRFSQPHTVKKLDAPNCPVTPETFKWCHWDWNISRNIYLSMDVLPPWSLPPHLSNLLISPTSESSRHRHIVEKKVAWTPPLTGYLRAVQRQESNLTPLGIDYILDPAAVRIKWDNVRGPLSRSPYHTVISQ